jgi:hypothetical protein
MTPLSLLGWLVDAGLDDLRLTISGVRLALVGAATAGVRFGSAR